MKLKDKSGILYVEIFVGMAKMVAWWHEHALGFKIYGKREQKGQYGLEITYWLRQGNANLLITSAMEPAAHDVVSFVDRHGNSIKRFAVEVDDAEIALEELKKDQAIFLSRGIEIISEGDASLKQIRCKLFDDNEIVFVERNTSLDFLPGFSLQKILKEETPIAGIDHLASVVRVNESDFWNGYLSRIMNLEHVQTIGEEFFANLLTGMKMNVLHSKSATINKVIVEPLPEKSRKSQVDVFLQHHFGNGIQHLAFEVKDLVEVVKRFKNRGVSFTPVPSSYYDALEKENPELPVKLFRKCNILCEKEDDKLLLQVFTEPMGDRPTLFYEFVQRVNAYDGFGANNVKQLFRSLEIQLSGEV